MKGIKILDEKFRLFGFINIIDIVFLITLVVFFLLTWRFSSPQNVVARDGDVKINYTVELQRKAPGYSDNIKVGADLQDSLKGLPIGKIVGVTVSPFLEEVADHNANIIRRIPVSYFETIYIQVEAMANVTDMTTTIGTHEVLVGKEIYMRTKDFAGSGYVVNLERSE